MIKKIASIGVVGLVMVFATLFTVIATSNASHNNNQPERKVTICHANNNVNQPYGPSAIEVNESAVDGDGNNDHDDHNGPVPASVAAAQEMKDDHDDWGDIIPPVSGVTNGQNWNTVGKAIWNNNCQYPKLATAVISETPATCQSGEKLVYGAIANAVFSGSANGKVGPSSYSVTATANSDSLFSNLSATKTFTGYLSDKLTGAQCVASAALSAVIPATCTSGEKLVYGAIANAVFSGSANGLVGPADYSVTATATGSARFSGNLASLVFSGTLAGPLVSEDCIAAASLALSTPATCEAPEMLNYGSITYATFSGDADGTTGPGSYSVTATANSGKLFAADTPGVSEDRTTVTFTGTLSGPLTGDDCVLGDDDEVPTPTEEPTDEPDGQGQVTEDPEVLPNTAAPTPLAVIAALAIAAGLGSFLILGFRGAFSHKL